MSGKELYYNEIREHTNGNFDLALVMYWKLNHVGLQHVEVK